MRPMHKYVGSIFFSRHIYVLFCFGDVKLVIEMRLLLRQPANASGTATHKQPGIDLRLNIHTDGAAGDFSIAVKCVLVTFLGNTLK